MAKGYQRAKGRSGPNFIMLRHDMMDSEAWRTLSAHAQALWCHIRRRYNGNNNGEIPLSCREAGQLLNAGKGTARLAFIELLEHGFIRVGEFSNFTLKTKKSRRWIMTHEAYGGKGPSNEWRAYSKTEKNRPA